MNRWFVSLIVSFTTLFILSACNSNTKSSESQDDTPPTNNSSLAQAQFGSLADAEVSIYKFEINGSLVLQWKETTSSGTALDEIGYFPSHITSLEKESFYLYKVTGGKDWDLNQDGVLDANFTLNKGSIYAFAQTKDLIEAGSRLKVTIASELLYELIAKELKSDINATQLQLHIDTYAKTVVTDIDNNGKINNQDVLIYSVPPYKPMMQEEYKNNLNLYINNIHQGNLALPNITILSEGNITLSENIRFVTQMQARVLNGAPITWSIKGGDDQALFTVESNGSVTFKSAPDFENPQDTNKDNIYNLTVQASDGSQQQTLALKITITNLNDSLPVINTNSDISISEAYTKVVQLHGSDADGDLLSWSITDGTDKSLFTIDTNTTTLHFKTAPNFEHPSDNDHNNIYEVAITLSDGKHNVSKMLHITITDIRYEAFILTIKTDNNGTTNDRAFLIPTKGSSYNYNVDCENDGIFEATAVDGNYTCNYATQGTYHVVIQNNSQNQDGFPRIYFNNEGDKNKLLAIAQWGSQPWASMRGAFYGCKNLTSIGDITADTPNLSLVKSMANMFKDASSFNQDISQWNVSNVEDMSAMFYGATAFNQDLSDWNTSHVTTMSYMFKAASSYNQDMWLWDTSHVTDMSGMFYGAKNFNQNINHWDTSYVIDMSAMFKETNIFNQPLQDWNTTNVTHMDEMFYDAVVFNQNLNSWNTSHVKDMSSMFKAAPLFNQNLTDWNTTNVTNMGSMFYGAVAFNGTIENWDVANVVSMYSMFKDASHFNQNIEKWNTAKVQNMNSMFYNATTFNKSLKNWNTKNVTNMGSMFKNAFHFNQDITQWDTAQVTDMHSMFYNDSAFNQNLNNWNTAKVTNMNAMFKNAIRFNQSLSSWNTENVTDMNSMFYGATNFNQYLGQWNTANVTDMYAMFKDAIHFNQNISGWDTSSVTNMGNMFKNLATFNQNLTNWDTGHVTDMNNMFYGATQFDGDISQWNVANVTDMNYMFKDAAHFNQDIGNWDTSKVTNMKGMFYGATAFNQYIGNWDISHVTDISFMFKNATAYNQYMLHWNTENVITMSGVFYNASSFNQNISQWNTAKVTNMNSMFYNAESFANQDLSGWDVTNVINHDNFFKHTGEGNVEPIWP